MHSSTTLAPLSYRGGSLECGGGYGWSEGLAARHGGQQGEWVVGCWCKADRVASVVILHCIGGQHCIKESLEHIYCWVSLPFALFITIQQSIFVPSKPFSLFPFHFPFSFLSPVSALLFPRMCVLSHRRGWVTMPCLANLKTVELYCFTICLVTLYSFSWRHISSWVNVVWELLFNCRHIYLYAYLLTCIDRLKFSQALGWLPCIFNLSVILTGLICDNCSFQQHSDQLAVWLHASF